MTADSPSSHSPKPDENPIQRAPKPEMLEKARETLRAWSYLDCITDEHEGGDLFETLATLVALALEAERESSRAEATKAEKMLRAWLHGQIETETAALTPADPIWRENQKRGAIAALNAVLGYVNTSAAIRAPRPPGETTPCRSCEGRGYFDVIQVPSSPTPPTSPPTMTGHDLAKAVVERFQPTPPSEEPRPHVHSMGMTMCLICGESKLPVPSPEPPSHVPGAYTCAAGRLHENYKKCDCND